MPPLTDPERLQAYKDALSNHAFIGYVQFELTEQSRRWIRQVLGVALSELGRLMHEFVCAGGRIDEVPENRPEWSGEHEFHYDLRFAVRGIPVYIETRLHDARPFQPDKPRIQVVNVHAP